jgi:hypothetical protein
VGLGVILGVGVGTHAVIHELRVLYGPAELNTHWYMLVLQEYLGVGLGLGLDEGVGVGVGVQVYVGVGIVHVGVG